MFKPGTEFRYKVSKTLVGRPAGIPFIETYRIVSVEGDSVKVEKLSEIEECQTFETDTSFGSYVFRTEGLRTVSRIATQVELEGCPVYADTLFSEDDDGTVTLLLGRDGIAYKHETVARDQDGNYLKTLHRLVSVTVDGRVYDDIKWVDEGEAPEDESSEEDEESAGSHRPFFSYGRFSF